MSEDLDRQLVVAVATRDAITVARIYTEAANASEASGDIDHACFLLTQAWIFALEAGDPKADQIRARLVAHGREIAE